MLTLADLGKSYATLRFGRATLTPGVWAAWLQPERTVLLATDLTAGQEASAVAAMARELAAAGVR